MTTATPDPWHLAALLDGEPGPGGFEVAIEALEQDATLRTRFERGLLIGQVLRGEASMPAARTISARVSAALATEPVPMRPARRRRVPAPINRPAAALAIAASLVAVAVLLGPGLLSGPAMEAPGMAPDIAQQRTAEPADSDAQVVERWTMAAPAGSTALDALLVDHRERASASGLTGFIPYAAVVGQSGLR
jgi:negative regulator of sigma E activity